MTQLVNGAFCLSRRRRQKNSFVNPRSNDPFHEMIFRHDDNNDAHRRRRLFVLASSSSSSSSSSFKSNVNDDESGNTFMTNKRVVKTMTDDDDGATIPWGDFQEWALRDNLPRYLVTVSTGDSSSATRTFCLWRTMINDVPELSGYDVPSLLKMHDKIISLSKNDNDDGDRSSSSSSLPTTTPGVMPQLDQFQFDLEGGITGCAYGLLGIADGTTVRTPPLAELEVTVPRGYVRTTDGGVFYELGVPSGGSSGGETRGWEATKEGRMAVLKSLAVVRETNKAVVEAAVAGGRGMAVKGVVEEVDGDGQFLLKLGGLTSIVLAGATAVNLLQHHLTVNVFWV